MTHELLLKVFKGVSLIDLSDCTFEYFDEENELAINANFEGRVIDSISYDGNLFYMMDNDGVFIALNPMKSAFDIAYPAPQTDAPFPDKMTFKEFLTNMFNVDFMSADELQAICDAGEMYANGCIKNSQTDASGLIDKWEKQVEMFKKEFIETDSNQSAACHLIASMALTDLKNQSIKVKI